MPIKANLSKNSVSKLSDALIAGEKNGVERLNSNAYNPNKDTWKLSQLKHHTTSRTAVASASKKWLSRRRLVANKPKHNANLKFLDAS